ncbi:MAG: hypothetical protein ACTS4U_00105 [Candidatus Hodgkinia cicadicola]
MKILGEKERLRDVVGSFALRKFIIGKLNMKVKHESFRGKVKE